MTYLERSLVRERISRNGLCLQSLHERHVGVEDDHPSDGSEHGDDGDEVL